VTSVSAEMASPNRGEYCVSKAGLAMAAKLFAVRLAPAGVPVYEVRPGIISTDMTAGVRQMYDQRIADGLVPEQRWGRPDDVGRASPPRHGDLPCATGSVIHVDGGWRCLGCRSGSGSGPGRPRSSPGILIPILIPGPRASRTAKQQQNG
jgi:NAD(P)-dependent dehydrogenase (short-subunit alcohol dehydrogenase family)